jgi:hypothetical protein
MNNQWTTIDLQKREVRRRKAKEAEPMEVLLDDPESDRIELIYRGQGKHDNKMTLVAIRNDYDDDGSRIDIGVLLSTPTRSVCDVDAVDGKEFSYNITAGQWTAAVDILMKVEEDRLCYLFNEDTRSVVLPLSQLIVSGDQQINPSQLLRFEYSAKLALGQGTAPVENFTIDSTSYENLLELM